jgi:hypothetical protein
VVAELKRGRAPDTVELQAIKYAAMASHFTLDQLAELHARFLERTSSQKLTNDEAEERLQAHVAADVELAPDLFLSPRIVLLAESYPDTTTTSVVWLNDQGIEITLRRYNAYVTQGDETIVSVAQVYPLPEVGVLSPGRAPKKRKPLEDLPIVPWTVGDFTKLIELGFPVPIEALNACGETPGQWVSANTIYERASIDPPSGRGRMAGFGFSVRTTFGRSNPPWEVQWMAGGEHCQYYKVDQGTAEEWHVALDSVDEGSGSDK